MGERRAPIPKGFAGPRLCPQDQSQRVEYGKWLENFRRPWFSDMLRLVRCNQPHVQKARRWLQHRFRMLLGVREIITNQAGDIVHAYHSVRDSKQRGALYSFWFDPG